MDHCCTHLLTSDIQEHKSENVQKNVSVPNNLPSSLGNAFYNQLMKDVIGYQNEIKGFQTFLILANYEDVSETFDRWNTINVKQRKVLQSIEPLRQLGNGKDYIGIARKLIIMNLDLQPAIIKFYQEINKLNICKCPNAGDNWDYGPQQQKICKLCGRARA